MGAESKIEWTHHTFNAWWGCTRVSPGCEHCYAETFAKRTGLGWGVQAERRTFGAKHWAEPLKWDRKAREAGERHRVFCSSMADVFEDRRELDAERAKLWELIAATADLDWLLLTKRPENLRRMLPPRWLDEPQHNVWLGTTVEDQRRADERIPELLAVPAVVRFLSCEPLLGPVELGLLGTLPREIASSYTLAYERLDWVIVGGESGPGARPFDVKAAHALVQECRDAGVPVFVKQLGARPEQATVDVFTSEPMVDRWRPRDPKGGDIGEFPVDLRVREFPEVRHAR